MKHWLEAVSGWLEEPLSEHQYGLLEKYHAWLAAEAMPAGGLGPGESKRIEERHLADSLAFGIAIPISVRGVLDVGSGVGLPGIPLAIMRPGTDFVLLDRSGRRVDLAARAIRILGLDNARCVQGTAEDWKEPSRGIVSRASLPLDKAYPLFRRLLARDGVGAFGLSRTDDSSAEEDIRSSAAHHGLAADIIDIPVLDSPTRLLRIVRSDHYA